MSENQRHHVPEVLRSIGSAIKKQTDRVRQWKFSQWAKDFNPSQWCYFVAFILIILSFFFDNSDNFSYWIGWIAFAGLARELLHLFQRLWQTTLGKSIILILYASTANIALAYAAMKINAITGIEPTPFIFTLGFTTLVLLPFWITISTSVMFLLFLILANLWILLRLPLRLLGMKVKVHWEDKKYALRTMVLRVFLIPFAVGAIFSAAMPYFAEYLDMAGIQVDEEQASETDQASVNKDNSGFRFNFGGETTPEDFEQARKTNQTINSIIADFIWYFEAYPSSACIKPNEARAVVIDENATLLVFEDEEQDTGYRYEVIKCEYRVKNANPMF